MNVLLILIPVSIVLLAVAAYAFFWAVDHDQLDDFDAAQLLPVLDGSDRARANEKEPAP